MLAKNFGVMHRSVSMCNAQTTITDVSARAENSRKEAMNYDYDVGYQP